MAKGLTEKQRKILEFIIDFQRDRGFPPTIRELGDAFEIGSLRGVTVHLDALQKKNFISRERTSRSIRVVAPDPREDALSQRTETALRLPLIRSVSLGDTLNEKLVSEGQVERYVAVPEEVAGPATEAGFVIRVGATGVKSEPILPGDLLVVRPQRVAHEGELVITFSHGDMNVARASDAETEAALAGDTDVIGRVVGLIRRY